MSNMVLLPTTTVNRIVDALPIQLVMELQKHPSAIVAGGFCRDLAFDPQATPTDVDVWVVEGECNAFRRGLVFSPVQTMYVPDPRQHVETKFDFTCCICWVGWEKDKGFVGYAHPQFEEDVKARRLVFANEISNPRREIYRVIKLVGKGYTIDPPTLSAVIAATVMATKHAGGQLVREEVLRKELEEVLKPFIPEVNVEAAVVVVEEIQHSEAYETWLANQGLLPRSQSTPAVQTQWAQWTTINVGDVVGTTSVDLPAITTTSEVRIDTTPLPQQQPRGEVVGTEIGRINGFAPNFDWGLPLNNEQLRRILGLTDTSSTQ